ncbi:MAG: S8 family serine peptidase [Phycisphaerales bacterium]
MPICAGSLAAVAGLLTFSGVVVAASEPRECITPEGVMLCDPEVLSNPALTRHPSHVMVRVVPGAAADQVAVIHKNAGMTRIVWTYELVPGLMCVEVGEGNVDPAIKAYQQSATVMYAEPDFVRRASAQSTPYGINLVSAPSAWTNSRGAGAIVADLDTGIDVGHPDLPTPAATSSFISGQTVQDGNGHGTHTAGTIAAIDNTDGVVGVAPSVTLLVGKVLADSGNGADSGIIAGINWARTNNADVVSMSLGGGAFSQSFQDTITAAFNAGMVIVAASGNDGTDTPEYPASYNNVISVAAVDSARNRASFSNFGPTISISAPGVNVFSTFSRSVGVTTAVIWGGVTKTSTTLQGSGVGNLTQPAVYCGLGNPADFPLSVAGKIAHIRRGTLTFQAKVNNAIAAGAIGVVVSNNTTGNITNGTLNQAVTIPVVGITQADGDFLQANDGTVVTINRSGSSYATESGTSMACPHVAGVAGLLFGKYHTNPGLTPTLVRQAMEQTATDRGDVGRDDLYGYGVVNAAAAMTWLGQHLPSPCPADIAAAGGAAGSDGQVTVDDLVFFLSAFFANNTASADIVGAGGSAGSDGTVGVDDLVAYLSRFFAPCP